MRCLKNTMLLSFLLITAGCQSQYGDMKFFMGGVESTPLTDDREMIVARGNAYTDSARIMQFVMLKAAEDCLAKGYTKFGFLSAADTGNTSLIVSRGAATTEGRLEKGFGDTATVSGTTRYQDSFITPVVVPGSTVVVKFFKGGELTTNTFDAGQVSANLGPVLKKK